MKFFTSFERPPRAYAPSGGVSATVQDFAKDCDINEIVKRARRTGTLPLVPSDLAFGVAPDETMQDVLNRQVEIAEYFDGLPSNIRLQYGNNVSNFIASMNTDEGIKQARNLGLLPPEQPAEPAEPVVTPVEVSTETQSATPSS